MAAPWLLLIQKQICGCPRLVSACEAPQAPAAPGLSARGVSRPAPPGAPACAASGAQIYLSPRMFFVFLILLGTVRFSFSCQRNSQVYRGCSTTSSTASGVTTHAKRTLEPKSPKPPRATEVRSLGGCLRGFPEWLCGGSQKGGAGGSGWHSGPADESSHFPT